MAPKLSLLQLSPSQQSVSRRKGKGKAMEEDQDEEEAIQRYKQELADFGVPTTFNDKLLASLLPPPTEYYVGDVGLLHGAKISGGRKGEIMLVSLTMRALVLSKNGTCDCCLADNMADHCWYPTGERPCWRCYHKSKGCMWKGVGVRTQPKRSLASMLVLAKHIKLIQAAKVFLEWQGKPSQFFVLEGYKGKGKAKALLGDFGAGSKCLFKLRDVDSDSEAEEEEDWVHKIKRIEREHVEKKLTSARTCKEATDLDKVEIVEPRAPVAGPLHLASKPIVWVPHAPRPISRLIVMPVSPVTGPSSPLVVNQASKVPDMQGTLRSYKSSEEDAPGNEDDSDSDDHASRDDNSTRHSEGAQSVALRTVISEVEAPVSAPMLEMVEEARHRFELACHELQWILRQHNTLVLYLRNGDSVMGWQESNNVKLGDFPDIEDLPIDGSIPLVYPQ
ncbi:hypothetical protein C0995_007417 [Termitomyces sp. Mi166|nr:hypothetical protein C0995_007417 [Termitomyces sp. Mi166\